MSAINRPASAEPKNLRLLLHWLRRQMEYEYPDKLTDSEIGEGGTPNLGRAFIAYLDGSPFATDVDGYYRWPLKAAIAFMAHGPRGNSGDPFMARFCYLVTRCDYDWSMAAARMGIKDEIAEVYATESLRRLWRYFTHFPAVHASRN